jgi:phage terminase large subunit-like protein
VVTKQLNILDFIKDLNLLEGSELSPAQRTILKATYGRELSPAELDIFRRATGRETYEPREHNEATVIVGRQGGKTSRIGASIATYEACRDHGLKRRERAYVLLIAPVTEQAQIAFGYIRDFFLSSPPLKNKV